MGGYGFGKQRESEKYFSVVYNYSFKTKTNPSSF